MTHRLSESDVSPAIARKIAARASRADEAVVVGTRAGVIEWANAAWSKVTGFAVDDAIDKPIGWLLDAAEIDAPVVDFVQRHFLTGLRCEVELPVTTPDGRKLWIHLDVEPFRDAQGEVADFVAVATDITARREGELALEQRIAQALADTEDDTSEHGRTFEPSDRVDVATLESLVAFAQISEAGEPITRWSREVDANDVLKRVRAISRNQLEKRMAIHDAKVMTASAIDLREMLGTVCRPVVESLPKTVALDAEIDPNVPTIFADRDALHVLVRDLFDDASHAIGDEWGTLSLSVGLTDPGRALPSAVHPTFDRFPLTTDHAHVFIELHDTAISLSRESCRYANEATGETPQDARTLSLALASARARALGATLRVHSVPGNGTRVLIYLPI